MHVLVWVGPLENIVQSTYMYLKQFPSPYNVKGHLPRMTVLLLGCPFLVSFIFTCT